MVGASANPTRVLPVLLGALAVLTLVYRLGIPPLIEGTLTAPFAARVLLSFVLSYLGLILGMFMPFGLRTVGALSDHPDEYVAWGWAINGVFSVIGSVLTTILAMSWGFTPVRLLSLGIYAIAVVVLWRLMPGASHWAALSPGCARRGSEPGSGTEGADSVDLTGRGWP
ncbi:MAG: hypothetical protein R2789_10295 [Microthrixaceae bacterium]